MVSRFTGYAVQPNKAIVGRNAFAHESGHPPGRRAQGAHDLRDHGRRPTSASSRTRSCSASTPGRHALRDALEQLGFKVEGNALNQAFKRFKEIADKKKQVTALDLEAIVSDEVRERAEALRARLVRRRGLGARASRTAQGRGDACPSGEESVGESGGDGPVDAIFGAIQRRDRRRVRAAPVHRLRGHRGRGRARRGDGDAARPRAPRQSARASRPTSSRRRRAPTCGRSRTRSRAPRSARPRALTADARRAHAGDARAVAHRLRRMAGSLDGRKVADHRRLVGDRRGDRGGVVAEGAAVALGARRKDRLDELAGADRRRRRHGGRDRGRHRRRGRRRRRWSSGARGARWPRLPGQQRRRDAARPVQGADTERVAAR